MHARGDQEPGPPRVPPAGDRGRCRPAGRLGAAGAGGGRFVRGGYPARSPGGAALPQLPVPHRARPGGRRGRARPRRPRAGLAAVVLPLGPTCRTSGLFRVADAGRLTDPAVLRAETLRMLADPKAPHARHRLRGAVAAVARARPRQAGPGAVPCRRRRAARRDAHRDRAVPAGDRARRPQRARSARRAVHVRQRPARPALRDSRDRGRSVPAGRSRRKRSAAVCCRTRAS